MNNLAHPALSGLIIDFFYTGSGVMGNVFPEVFDKEVPHAAVVLAATVVHSIFRNYSFANFIQEL